MFKKKKKSQQAEGLSTTMMVDVLFILLIFFILISNIKKSNIKINTAKVSAEAQAQASKKETIEHVVTVDKKNQIFLDGQAIASMEELQQKLAAIKQQETEKTAASITLRTDSESSSGKLIEIFAILGITKLAENSRIEVEASAE